MHRHTITVRTTGEEVTRAADGRWDVRVTGPDGTETRTYDAVLVANGHHWDARWPEHERDTRRFYVSPRHTLEVEFDHYLWDLARERRKGRSRASS